MGSGDGWGWGGAAVGGEEWRQLYLNNNKKSKKKRKGRDFRLSMRFRKI